MSTGTSTTFLKLLLPVLGPSPPFSCDDVPQAGQASLGLYPSPTSPSVNDALHQLLNLLPILAITCAWFKGRCPSSRGLLSLVLTIAPDTEHRPIRPLDPRPFRANPTPLFFLISFLVLRFFGFPEAGGNLRPEEISKSERVIRRHYLTPRSVLCFSPGPASAEAGLLFSSLFGAHQTQILFLFFPSCFVPRSSSSFLPPSTPQPSGI